MNRNIDLFGCKSFILRVIFLLHEFWILLQHEFFYLVACDFIRFHLTVILKQDGNLM